jgi:hypothetical protein
VRDYYNYAVQQAITGMFRYRSTLSEPCPPTWTRCRATARSGSNGC